MMRLFQPGRVTPVESHRRDPIEARAPVEVPEVGLCWGRPSAFAFSERARSRGDPTSVTIVPPDGQTPEYMRIVRATLQIKAAVVEIADGSGNVVQVDRFERMMFSWLDVMPKPTIYDPQPHRTVSYDMTFVHHPTNESAV